MNKNDRFYALGGYLVYDKIKIPGHKIPADFFGVTGRHKTFEPIYTDRGYNLLWGSVGNNNRLPFLVYSADAFGANTLL